MNFMYILVDPEGVVAYIKKKIAIHMSEAAKYYLKRRRKPIGILYKYWPTSDLEIK